MRRLSLFMIALFLGVLAFPSVSVGVMSSTNYTIFADSIDAGGVLSTSGTYSLEDTFGESPVGTSTGGVYEIRAGYQAMDWSTIELTVSTNTINLGTVGVASVATSSVLFYVTSTAPSGYVLSVNSVGGTSLTAVSDGAVTAGSEEYGVAVSGVDAAFADDRGVAGGLNLSASSTSVVNVQTTLTFKAAVSSATSGGARSQSVVVSASTNI